MNKEEKEIDSQPIIELTPISSEEMPSYQSLDDIVQLNQLLKQKQLQTLQQQQEIQQLFSKLSQSLQNYQSLQTQFQQLQSNFQEEQRKRSQLESELLIDQQLITQLKLEIEQLRKSSNSNEFKSPKQTKSPKITNKPPRSDTDLSQSKQEYIQLSSAHCYAFGSQGATIGLFDEPRGVCFGLDENVYVADKNNNRIQLIKLDGSFIRLITNLGSSMTSSGNNSLIAGTNQLNAPWSVYLTKEGNLLISDYGNKRIVSLTSSGSSLLNCFSTKNYHPRCVITDRNDQIIVSFDGGLIDSGKVEVFQSDGTFVKQIGSKSKSIDGQLNLPVGLALNSQDLLFIGDSRHRRISIFDQNGDFISNFGQFGDSWLHVSIDSKDRVIISDRNNNCLFFYDSDGNLVSKFGQFGSKIGKFNEPAGVCVNQLDQVVVADCANHRIQIVQSLF